MPAGDFYNHMTAARIRDLIGDQAFGRMYKFCVERDPVEKCISHFHMLRNSALHNRGGMNLFSWDEYCNSGKFPVDIDKYSEIVDKKRVLMVDRILRYERLQEELSPLLEDHGIAGFRLQAREKSDYRSPELIKLQDVTPEQRHQIESAFAPTCKVTGLYRPLAQSLR